MFDDKKKEKGMKRKHFTKIPYVLLVLAGISGKLYNLNLPVCFEGLGKIGKKARLRGGQL